VTPFTGESVRSVIETNSPAASLLAIDLGSTLGWALRLAHGTITSGTATFRPGRFEGGGMGWLRFRRWLDEMAGTVGPIGSVVFEEVRRHDTVDRPIRSASAKAARRPQGHGRPDASMQRCACF